MEKAIVLVTAGALTITVYVPVAGKLLNDTLQPEAAHWVVWR